MAQITKKTNKKGETVFRIRVSCGYDYKGRQRTKSMTYKPKAKSPKQIEKEVQKQAILFEQQCSEQPLQQKIKFADLADEWLAYETEKGKLKIGSLEVYKGLRERTYNYLGHMYIENITRKVVQKFIFALAKGADGKKPLKQKTQKNYLAFVSNAFTYAVKNEYIKESPCKAIEVTETESEERDPYTLDEEVALLKKLNEKGAPTHYKVFFMLLIHLGMRKGEALAIEWKDIDFSAKSVFIRRNSQYRNSSTGVYTTLPKTKGSIRCLKLPDEIIDLLPKLKAEQEELKRNVGDNWVEYDRLFTTWNGEPMRPNRPYTWLQKFCEREDLPFKGLHNFRHALVTNLVHERTDIATVSSIVGHSNPNITLGIYTHEIKEAIARGCDTISNLLKERMEKSAS
ncbi:MAG: site-specific integrase [Ruminococcus sp.]|nr:site-specific integrase [Ruminococcus sp.]